MKPLLAVLSLAALTACGPTYRTNYTLMPPASKEGQVCSANVKIMADTCISNCRQMAYNCRGSGFSTNIGIGSGGYHGGGFGYNQSLMNDRDCSPTQCEDSCMTAARQSHLNCGGTITENVVCTANCPKENPQR